MNKYNPSNASDINHYFDVYEIGPDNIDIRDILALQTFNKVLWVATKITVYGSLFVQSHTAGVPVLGFFGKKAYFDMEEYQQNITLEPTMSIQFKPEENEIGYESNDFSNDDTINILYNGTKRGDCSINTDIKNITVWRKSNYSENGTEYDYTYTYSTDFLFGTN